MAKSSSFSLIKDLETKYNKLYEKLQNILINLEDRGIHVYTREKGVATRVYSDKFILNILQDSNRVKSQKRRNFGNPRCFLR